MKTRDDPVQVLGLPAFQFIALSKGTCDAVSHVSVADAGPVEAVVPEFVLVPGDPVGLTL